MEVLEVCNDLIEVCIADHCYCSSELAGKAWQSLHRGGMLARYVAIACRATSVACNSDRCRCLAGLAPALGLLRSGMGWPAAEQATSLQAACTAS